MNDDSIEKIAIKIAINKNINTPNDNNIYALNAKKLTKEEKYREFLRKKISTLNDNINLDNKLSEIWESK